MIGLFDCDLLDGWTPRPNPEIMLLSSYFKKKGEIVHLLLDFKNIDLYSKVFIRKNRQGEKITVTPDIYTRDNVDYGGLFFTKGIYTSIPKEVLECEPDITIYDRYLRTKKWESKTERELLGNFKAEFISIHQKHITETHSRKVFIIDPDISTDDYDYLCSIHRFTPAQVFHFYYPLMVESFEGLKKFLNADWMYSRQEFQFSREITVEEMRELKELKKPKMLFRAYLNTQTRIREEEVYEKWLLSSLEKIFISRTESIPIKFTSNPRTRAGSIPLLYKLEKWGTSFTYQPFYETLTDKEKVSCLRIINKYPSSRELFFSNIKQFQSKGGEWNNEWS